MYSPFNSFSAPPTSSDFQRLMWLSAVATGGIASAWLLEWLLRRIG